MDINETKKTKKDDDVDEEDDELFLVLFLPKPKVEEENGA